MFWVEIYSIYPARSWFRNGKLKQKFNKFAIDKKTEIEIAEKLNDIFQNNNYKYLRVEIVK